MYCEKCGTEMQTGQKFCTNCGAEIQIYCQKCGRLVEKSEKFCMECGNPLDYTKHSDSLKTETMILRKTDSSKHDDEFIHYRNVLMEKSKTEKIMLAVTTGIILLFTVLYYTRNPGDDRFLETVIVGGVIAGVLLAVYGLIAGNIGVYEATKYLKQYDTIKSTAGEKEAVLFIEKEYHPEERGKGIAINGMKITAGGAKTAGGCFIGCLQMVTGFFTSIIAVILAMAFC